MSRSSARRGQTEPLAALAAVLAVAIGVSVYAGALPNTGEHPRRTAETTLTRVYEEASHAGVVSPDRFQAASLAGPAGYDVNATLSLTDVEVSRGPVPPADAANASRPVSVRVDDGSVRSGRLSVEVWT